MRLGSTHSRTGFKELLFRTAHAPEEYQILFTKVVLSYMSTGSYFIEEEEKYASHCMVGIGRFLRLDVVGVGALCSRDMQWCVHRHQATK